MNAPLQNGLQAAVARAHRKPKVFWTAREQALVVAETDRLLLLGADPEHSNIGPLIKAAQLALPEHRRRCVNSATIGLVREALLAQAPAPERVVATPAETQYVLRREVTAHELIDVLESNPNAKWGRGDGGRLWVVERTFANAQEVADFYVNVGFVEEVKP